MLSFIFAIVFGLFFCFRKMEENIKKTEEHLSKVSLEDQNKGIRTG
jgi:hypothetical protein